MKWNDVEMIDGKFYFIEVERWSDGLTNNWVFAYKENMDFLTEHYVAAKIDARSEHTHSIYDVGHVCSKSKIISIRPATHDDMCLFWDYLEQKCYKYNLNTKKLRYVGCQQFGNR